MSGTSLMLIEHDATVQTLLIDIFTDAGYDVCAALSVDDVRTMLAWFKPEVVVISGGSRGSFASGWDMARVIADIDPTLPLVMLTTHYAMLQEVGQTERGNLFAAGLLKPFNLEELLATVARCLRSHRGAGSVAPATLPRLHARIFHGRKRRCV